MKEPPAKRPEPSQEKPKARTRPAAFVHHRRIGRRAIAGLSNLVSVWRPPTLLVQGEVDADAARHRAARVRGSASGTSRLCAGQETSPLGAVLGWRLQSPETWRSRAGAGRKVVAEAAARQPSTPGTRRGDRGGKRARAVAGERPASGQERPTTASASWPQPWHGAAGGASTGDRLPARKASAEWIRPNRPL